MSIEQLIHPDELSSLEGGFTFELDRDRNELLDTPEAGNELPVSTEVLFHNDNEDAPAYSEAWLEAKALEKVLREVGGTNWEFDRRFCGDTGLLVGDLLSEEQIRRDAQAEASAAEYGDTATEYDEARVIAARMEQQAFLSENVGEAYVDSADEGTEDGVKAMYVSVSISDLEGRVWMFSLVSRVEIKSDEDPPEADPGTEDIPDDNAGETADEFEALEVAPDPIPAPATVETREMAAEKVEILTVEGSIADSKVPEVSRAVSSGAAEHTQVETAVFEEQVETKVEYEEAIAPIETVTVADTPESVESAEEVLEVVQETVEPIILQFIQESEKVVVAAPESESKVAVDQLVEASERAAPEPKVTKEDTRREALVQDAVSKLATAEVSREEPVSKKSEQIVVDTFTTEIKSEPELAVTQEEGEKIEDSISIPEVSSKMPEPEKEIKREEESVESAQVVDTETHEIPQEQINEALRTLFTEDAETVKNTVIVEKREYQGDAEVATERVAQESVPRGISPEVARPFGYRPGGRALAVKASDTDSSAVDIRTRNSITMRRIAA